MSLKEKINNRLNNLQLELGSGNHLTDSDRVVELIDSISKFWSVLSEEDKDYIQAARHAIENRMEWK